MSMQVSCIPQPPVILPPSDLELMKNELDKIKTLVQANATDAGFEQLKEAVETLNEIILSVDNSNDFFKIGGFNVLMPLLCSINEGVVSAAAELIADLCQNNKFCQANILDFNILPELVKLLDHSDNKVCSKALYAISCLCRNNEDSIKYLEVTCIIPLLMKILQQSDERLRAKAAFFLSYLSTFESFREMFYQADVIGILIKLLKENQDSSSEHLLSALLAQVAKHKQSRTQCRQPEYNLKETLLEKINLYESKGEYQEAKEYCTKILDACFHEEMKGK